MDDRELRRFGISLLIGIFLSLFGASVAHAQWIAMNPVRKVQQEADGAVFTMGTGTLKVQVCSDSVIHVLYSATATFPKRPELCGN